MIATGVLAIATAASAGALKVNDTDALALTAPQSLPAGPAAASKAFLTAVPDLRVAVIQRLVVGDR
jgi:hypothetical protein